MMKKRSFKKLVKPCETQEQAKSQSDHKKNWLDHALSQQKSYKLMG